MHVSDLLFRGHQNAAWRLDTTLDRYTRRRYTKKDYYDLICVAKSAIEFFTGQSWALSPKQTEDRVPGPPDGYEFMIYLRHHGFPSPLLDWTRSPYVAAFFAFRANTLCETSDVAIFSYLEYCGCGKTMLSEDARVVGLGPFVRTHRRHYSQQSEYTICEKLHADEYVYWKYQCVFESSITDQDLVTKYILPRNARDKVMERLEIMNINAYSLFGHEESLMETLAYQEIEKRNP